MSGAERRISSGLALGLGFAGLLLDFTGWYTVEGALFGVLGAGFALGMPRGKLRRSALWLNFSTVGIAGVVLLAF